VADLCRKATEIAVSIICITEVFSACNRLIREGILNYKDYDWIKSKFLNDIEAAVVIDMTREVVGRSIECLESGTVRSLDAIHIASAIECASDIFVTSDKNQNETASIMGLNVQIV